MVSPFSLCIAPLIQASTHGAGLQWWQPSETARPPMPARNGSLPTRCTARRGRTDSPFKITDQSCFAWECSIAQASSQAWQPTHFRGSQNRRSIAPPRVDLVASCCTHSSPTCPRACVMPTQPRPTPLRLSGHFRNDCRLLAPNPHVDVELPSKTCLLVGGRVDREMPHKWWIFRRVAAFDGGFLP